MFCVALIIFVYPFAGQELMAGLWILLATGNGNLILAGVRVLANRVILGT